jgi:cyclic pyranopterin phosphate synthase
MPEQGVQLLQHADILRYEEIVDVVQMAVEMGIDKVRITGGEPLVRKGIVELVKQIAFIPGILDFGLTTNGILLSQFALPLAEAGLHRINISLDTLDPEKYLKITRGGQVQAVLDGIIAAQEAGLHPIKLNCVVRNSSDEPDARAVREFGEQNGLQVRYIHEMSLSEGRFTIVENGHGGDCAHCNRIRLTANGMIKPCLFDNSEFSIRKLGIKLALEMAISGKPARGSINDQGNFYNIGG